MVRYAICTYCGHKNKEDYPGEFSKIPTIECENCDKKVQTYSYSAPFDHVAAQVPHNDTDTSKLSAKQLKPFAGKIGHEIWAHLMHGGAKTCEQLEQELGMSHQTVSGRLTQLRKAGKIADTQDRRKNDTGRMAIVWRATASHEWDYYIIANNKRRKTQRELELEKRLQELQGWHSVETAPKDGTIFLAFDYRPPEEHAETVGNLPCAPIAVMWGEGDDIFGEGFYATDQWGSPDYFHDVKVTHWRSIGSLPTWEGACNEK